MESRGSSSPQDPVQAVLAEQRRFLTALLDLGDLAHETTNDEAFYQQLLERSVDVVPGAEGGSIQLAIPNTSSFRFVASVGFDLDELQENVLHKQFFRDAVNPRAQIVHEFEVESRSPEIEEWLERAGRLSEIKSNVSAPALVNGRAVAFLSIDNFSDSDAMTESSAEMTTVLARFIGDLYLRRQLEAERERKSAELHRRATTDELTGISNRSHLLDSLGGFLDGEDAPAVLFCDLDNFKLVNDSLGHRTGDALIAQIAERITPVLGSEGTLVGRLGGDEFLLLLRDADEAHAIEAAQQTLAAMQAPFIIEGWVLHVGMSIGISISCNAPPGLTAGDLLQQADTALYEAKAQGGAQYLLFDQAMNEAAARRLSIEQQLRVAMKSGGIEALYQPIVELPSRAVVGVEALIRWRRTDGELVAPSGFLDVAEDAGLLPGLGRIMMREATHLGARLMRNGVDLYVSINISAQELLNGALADDVLGFLDESGLPPENVLVEITESSVLNPDSVFKTLQALRQAGVRIALDDFGTGFSSLAHLRTLPIDAVKIDRSFVNDLVADPRTHAMTKSLLEMCGALGLQVILEGIETTEQANAVEGLGGALAQGYLYHRPMPAEDLCDLLLDRSMQEAA